MGQNYSILYDDETLKNIIYKQWQNRVMGQDNNAR